jgi:hypothetical protein
MGVKDLLHFNGDDYATHLSKFSTDGDEATRELQAREIMKRRQKASGVAKMFCSGALLPFTGGLSGIGIVLGARQRSVASQKLKVIHQTMSDHEISLPAHRKRDVLIPVATAAAISAASLGLLQGLEGVAEAGIEAGLKNGVCPTSDFASGKLDMARGAANDPGAFFRGVGYGAETHVEQLGAAAHPAAPDLPALPSTEAPQQTAMERLAVERAFDAHAVPQAFIDGNEAGKTLLPTVERAAVVFVLAETAEEVTRAHVKRGVEKRLGEKKPR